MDLVTPRRPGNDGVVRIRDRYFQFSSVDGKPGLEVAYRMRYQVYCIERGLLRPQDYPDGLEYDEYDAFSLHVLATHCSGEPAGTARMVMHSPLGFPLMRHCRFSGEYDYLNDPAYPGHSHGAEVSRLAISRAFRMRAGDSYYGGAPREDTPSGSAGHPPAALRSAPEVLAGVCRVMYQESKRRGITYWVLAMEKSLSVILNRIGLEFMPAGPESNYYGPVRPYFTTVERCEAELYKRSPERLRYFVHGLEPHLVPACVRPPDGD
ncbi:putative PEP-CTERM/exosortase system-associated acyltransferase [Thioflavicoccus mobilis 8321]|uniref:Putative PEP-CTERM/exosortase system-associated acyltransferase n=1 Tax=Thioflavicoccus mobilis 8321 TaxID=765912 RepID=L0GT50_9GAMM|nr:PEP-CTERM/exosortase system-associated acyltransferase [Thioflavicoccus mobilis]AGA89948.1 putative PEP-CTERM/exosortase system-associated acyltransferase [Thioflavicoccus mobilis 8321]